MVWPRGHAKKSVLETNLAAIYEERRLSMKNFEGLGLSRTLNESLVKMDYTTPTPIQAQAIPLALDGRDILGSAQTGTGKTAAFAIPLVEYVLNNPERNALVLTPTRELAKQVLTVVHQLLGRGSSVNTAFIIGGEAMHKQFEQLNRGPRIVVGTPGRINDHLRRDSLDLSKTDFLVLDETDRMLDMGFGVQLDEIFKFLPAQRQTLMFSATLPQGIIDMSSKYLNNPERIAIGATNVIAKNIKQEVIHLEQSQKYDTLRAELTARDGSVIVFVKTKWNADKIAKRLRTDGFKTDALHGDLRQRVRDKVMKNFRNQAFRILVATDIAARGLDVPHIEHVINHDLPQVAEDYIHRMGRTARAGAEGHALCFIAPQDARNWRQIEELLDPTLANQNRPNRNGKKGGKKRPQRGNDKFVKSRKKPWEVRGEKRKNDAENGGERPSNHRGKSNASKGKKPFTKDGAKSGAKSGGKPFAKKWDKPRTEGEASGNARGNRKSFTKRDDANGNTRASKPTHMQNKPDTPTGKPTGKKPFRKDGFKKGGFKGKSSGNGNFKGGFKGATKSSFKSNFKGKGQRPNKGGNKSNAA